MAKFHGKDGTVTFGSAVLNVIDWSISINVDMAEADCMGVDAKDTEPGHYGWSVNVNAYHDDTSNITGVGLTKATLTVAAKTGKEYSGSASLESKTPGASVNGYATMNYTFRGSGALTEPS